MTKNHDWWRINPRKNSSGDIYYCLKKGIVKARIKDGKWILKNVYDAQDALFVGQKIINLEAIQKEMKSD